jgi:hypothetical protein
MLRLKGNLNKEIEVVNVVWEEVGKTLTASLVIRKTQ